ncbi:MAG: geranylgeranyl reductase family protein [Clostridia bacterium]|nr:geranylgeranyl reductase family protein [Clostridia bacterium]MDH7573031.1 geranylgeranyl reductase family protein [Clostridia bacterium]
MDDPEMWDAAVVGGGPAGAAAAWYLAREGREVVVLEKAALPRYKACGGGVTRKAWSLLPGEPTEVVEDEMLKIVFCFGRAEPVEVRAGRPVARLVMRDRFDQWLLQQAQAAGARIISRFRVERLIPGAAGVTLLGGGGRQLSARVVVAADGAFSRTARALGIHLPLHRGVALEAELPLEEKEISAYRGRVYIDYGAVEQGYAWIFPKARHLSVGVGSFGVRGGRLPAALDAFLRSRKMERVPRAPARAHPLPILLRAPQAWHGTWGLAAGDAAGLVNPLTGEGIYYALQSGLWAAEAVIEHLKGRAGALEGYSRRLRARMWPDFAAARRLALLVYLSPGWAHAWLKRHPEVASVLMGVVSGEITYRELLRRVARRVPDLASRLKPGA